MAKSTHVWMLNIGGPDSTEYIKPFLQRLLGDPLVVELPFAWLQVLFAWFIATIRTPKVLPDYERMGGASPQLKMVEDQALLLGRSLGERYGCRPVLRYWGPSADQAAASVKDGDQIVLLSLYPHACQATTRTSLEDARRALADKKVQVAEVASYPTDAAYVCALAETVREAILALPRGADYHVLFSAHGIPVKYIQRGDPYQREIEASVAATVAELGLSHPHHLSFQSKLGPTRWLEPSTIQKVRDLGSAGVKALVVVPVAFTSEHIETLVELDRELQEIAHSAGIQHFARAPTVGTRPSFVRALAGLVRRAEQKAGWDVPELATAAEAAATRSTGAKAEGS